MDHESAKSNFKSKWNRLFKEKDQQPDGLQPAHTNSFQLNDDVAEFLRPSVEKASTRPTNPLAPKIDIAIAQRWPDANAVRSASAAVAPVVVEGKEVWKDPNAYRKPKRREGLVVGFVKTSPEIIGEGGDDCEVVVTEVAKARNLAGRDAICLLRQDTLTNQHGDDLGPPTVQRSQWSREESENSQRLLGRRPLHISRDAVPSPPKFSRIPTGFSSLDDEEQVQVPRLESREGSPIEQSETNLSLTARKRGMGASEGMILRRASAMITKTNNADEEQRRQSLALGVQPDSGHYETLSRTDAPTVMPSVPNRIPMLSPLSASSPIGPSPFDDVRYARTSAQDLALAQQSFPVAPPGPRQRRELYQPSYMRAARPPSSERSPDRNNAQQTPQSSGFSSSEVSAKLEGIQAPPKTHRQPSAPEQTVPQLPPIVSYSPTHADITLSRSDSHLSSMSTTGRPDSDNRLPAFAYNARIPEDIGQNREPSPLRNRVLEDDQMSGEGRQVFHRSSNANERMHYLASSASHVNSPSGSRNGESPQRQHSSGYGLLLTPSPRINAGYSPQDGSPKSSSLTSPSDRRLSPSGYFPASMPLQTQPNKASDTLRPSFEQVRWPASGSSSHSEHSIDPKPSSPWPLQPQQTGAHARNMSQQSDISTNSRDEELLRSDQYTRSIAPTQSLHGDPLVTNLQQSRNNSRPGTSGSTASSGGRSPQRRSNVSSAAVAAYHDFATRVAHMRGVFRLTAEKERSADQCTPVAWLRTAFWWYHRGKVGLETLLQQRPGRSGDQKRDHLAQPHVDLAKTWWILSEPLIRYEISDDISPRNSMSPSSVSSEHLLGQSTATLKDHLKALCLSMTNSQLMPPEQSLIQGQDTTVWLEYPDFTADAAIALRGDMSQGRNQAQNSWSESPIEVLPVGDTSDAFCYGRFPVEVSMSTEDPTSDRVVLPCMLSMLRRRRNFTTTIIIASQSDLVNIKVCPNTSNEHCTMWSDVSWQAGSFAIAIRLPRNFDVVVRVLQQDFRSLWNLVEYSRKVEQSLRAGPDESLVHESRLAELQYAESPNSNAFPANKIHSAVALVFERFSRVVDKSGGSKIHRGYRVVLATVPKHKSLSSVSHTACEGQPLYFEFVMDSSAGGMAALVLKFREEARQCKALLVFADVAARQEFYGALNGMTVGRNEEMVTKMDLKGLNIESISPGEGFIRSSHSVLHLLQWQRLGVTNGIDHGVDRHRHQHARTVGSAHLRLIARHATGCITDRMNLDQGELLLRLPCDATASMLLLRAPQEDLSLSIDTRQTHQSTAQGLSELMQFVQQHCTIRTFTFASHDDLHKFQSAITGFTVLYDGLASVLSISRRMMVVPVYKKWEASNVRVQVVAHDTVVQILAFMEDFAHTDAMCFQVKSTDTFESIKGDGKNKKWGVKLVDAKFSLPRTKETGKEDAGQSEDLLDAVKRRFVNLEGLEYAEEHDDIVVGFETMEGGLTASIMFYRPKTDATQSVIALLRHYPQRLQCREALR